MYNPRFPHELTAYRPVFGPDGIPSYDAEGNPEMEQIGFDVVVYNSSWDPVRRSDGSFVTEKMTSLPWGYRTSTGGIRDSGPVFVANYKIACPMFLNPLEEGVVLRLTDYDHTFDGVVKKKTTYNWGSNIWFDNPGNNAEVRET